MTQICRADSSISKLDRDSRLLHQTHFYRRPQVVALAVLFDLYCLTFGNHWVSLGSPGQAVFNTGQLNTIYAKQYIASNNSISYTIFASALQNKFAHPYSPTPIVSTRSIAKLGIHPAVGERSSSLNLPNNFHSALKLFPAGPPYFLRHVIVKTVNNYHRIRLGRFNAFKLPR